jgi:hypothetical protein
VIQEENFEKAKIPLFDETTTIHEELKEIKEMRGKKLNIEPQLNKMKNSIITEFRFMDNKIQRNLENGQNKTEKFFNSLQQNINIKVEDREPFKIIIKESASEIINEFKEYMQDMKINVNFELTKTIIRKNFKKLFIELTRMDDPNIDAFHLMQTSLSALPIFRDMDEFFAVMAKTSDIMNKFEEQRNFIDSVHNDNCIRFDLITSLITNGFDNI